MTVKVLVPGDQKHDLKSHSDTFDEIPLNVEVLPVSWNHT